MNYDLYLIIPSLLFLIYKVNFFDKLSEKSHNYRRKRFGKERVNILNRFLKEISAKQCSSKNLTKLATSIYEKNKGQINLQEFLKIVWDKNYINFEKS